MLAQLVFMLLAVGAALHLLGFKRTRDLLERCAPPPVDQEQVNAAATSEEVHRIARLVAIAAHHGPYRATCLRQSLLVWWLLRRKGMPAELRIGVRTQEGFAAHAWVEVRGQPVNDAPDVAERFAPFDGSLSTRLVSSP